MSALSCIATLPTALQCFQEQAIQATLPQVGYLWGIHLCSFGLIGHGVTKVIVDALLSQIKSLIADDNLAAVLVHLNDTYVIEERIKERRVKWSARVQEYVDLPGFARVASLIKRIRETVSRHLKEDRTLVLHSGDFLSPSFMSNTLGFHGEQIVELLDCCGVDYVTLGNHEFDHDKKDDMNNPVAVLQQRLGEAAFLPVGTNLTPPVGFGRWHRSVLWPESEPFLAIFGVAGRATADKAAEHGFGTEAWQAVFAPELDAIKLDRRIGCVVALSHMDREEDQNLQRAIGASWDGFAYVFGGHDHDIGWREQWRRCILSKNLQNCRSVTVALLPKDLVAAPPKSLNSPAEGFDRREMHGNATEAGRDPVAHVAEIAIADYRASVTTLTRQDFIEAFCRHLQRTASAYRNLIEGDIPYGRGGMALFDWALAELNDKFSRRSLFFHRLTSEALAELRPDPAAQKAISHWVEKQCKKAGSSGDQICRDFSSKTENLDATEKSLRSASTNFGNFIADAAMAATSADLALIHAGSFRIDDTLSAKIRIQDLRETFLFDNPKAVTVVTLSAQEVKNFYRHAQTKKGQGAFLQVSRSYDWIKKRRRRAFTVAISKYLLIDNEDGYQDLVAQSRSWEGAEIFKRLGGDQPPQFSLITLVVKGANDPEVAYSEECRLAAEGSDTTEDEALGKFIKLARSYRNKCKEVGLEDTISLMFLENSRFLHEGYNKKGTTYFDTIKENYLELNEYRNLILEHTFVIWKDLGGMRGITRLYEKLCYRRECFEDGIEYQRYLDHAARLIDDWVRIEIAKLG